MPRPRLEISYHPSHVAKLLGMEESSVRRHTSRGNLPLSATAGYAELAKLCGYREGAIRHHASRGSFDLYDLLSVIQFVMRTRPRTKNARTNTARASSLIDCHTLRQDFLFGCVLC